MDGNGNSICNDKVMGENLDDGKIEICVLLVSYDSRVVMMVVVGVEVGYTHEMEKWKA